MLVHSLRWDELGEDSLRSVSGYDSENTLILAFGDSSLLDETEVLERIARVFPRSKFMGCSTANAILGPEILEGELAVTFVKFEETILRLASAETADPSHSQAAGKSIARQLQEEDLRAVFVLSDGLHVNGSELVRGLNTVLGSDVILTGGLAGDGEEFSRTWVAYSGHPREGAVVAAGLYGSHVRVGHGYSAGWSIFGPERVITKSQGNVLYELDGRPALQLYRQYLGEHARELPLQRCYSHSPSNWSRQDPTPW